MYDQVLDFGNSLVEVQQRRQALLDSPSNDGIWAKLIRLLKLEQEFGHIMYIPFDIDPIVPDNEDKFKNWFFDHAMAITKLTRKHRGLRWADGVKPFLTVNSIDQFDSIYSQNKLDVDKEFPEIRKKLSQLPYRKTPGYKIWSSTTVVPPHRDHSYSLDLPCCFRSFLFDENPDQTLYVQEAPAVECGGRVFVSRHPTFAWNNFRVFHGSERDEAFRKALLIPDPIPFDPVKFKELMIRSLKKYEAEAIFCTQPRSAYWT